MGCGGRRHCVVVAPWEAAVERRDAGGLEQVAEPLLRTLNMFRGVVDSGRLRSS